MPCGWLLAEAPWGPAAVGQGLLAARRASAGSTSRPTIRIAPATVVHTVGRRIRAREFQKSQSLTIAILHAAQSGGDCMDVA